MRVQEYLSICDEQGNVIGRAGRDVVHAQELLHQAVHVLVVNSQGQVFLQRRGPHKDSFPNAWDSSVSGHVEAGETPDHAAKRELLEEVGLHGEPQLLGKLPASAETGWEFITVYTVQTDEPCRWNADEITGGRCLTPEVIEQELAAGKVPFTPTFKKSFGLWIASREGAAA